MGGPAILRLIISRSGKRKAKVVAAPADEGVSGAAVVNDTTNVLFVCAIEMKRATSHRGRNIFIDLEWRVCEMPSMSVC